MWMVHVRIFTSVVGGAEGRSDYIWYSLLVRVDFIYIHIKVPMIFGRELN